MRCGKTTEAEGFSLLEVIISSVLLLIVGFAILTMLSSSSRASLLSQRRTNATEIAESLLEGVKSEVKTADLFNTLTSRNYASIYENDEFIYDVEVASINDDMKYAGVSIYYRDKKSIAPRPDSKSPGRIVKLGTYLLRP
jgi:Tfp pilus assembly protein PilV